MSNENKPLSRSAQAVQDALTLKGLKFEVIELSSSTRTAKDAAATLGCEVAQIVKSLVFCTAQSKQAVLVLASGINRVNEKTLEEQLGEKINKADADFTRAATGYAIGGVPPVAHAKIINHIFIDEDLLKFDKLWAAAGTPNAVFSLSSADLENLTGGKVISIKII